MAVQQPVTYRYFIYSLGPNPQLHMEIPLSDVSYSNGFYTAYEFSGSVAVTRETEAFRLREFTTPGKYTLYVLRNGECVWGGILWSRSYSSESRTLEITALTFEAAFYARIWRRTRTYADNTSQYEVARRLIRDILEDYKTYTPVENWTGVTQGSPSSGGCPGQPAGSAYTIGNCYVTPLDKNADIGLTIPGAPPGVNESDPAFLTKETDGFLGHDMKSFGSVLHDFAKTPRQPDRSTSETDVAFEYRIRCDWVEAQQTFTRTLEFGYPKIRNDKTSAEHIFFDYPGSIQNFTYKETAEDSAVRAWVSGTGNGNEKIAQLRYSDRRVREGYLLTEVVESANDVEQPTVLYARATNLLQAKKIPRPEFDFTVIGWEYPRYMTPVGQPGSWRIGDWAQFVVRDPFWHGAYADERGIVSVRARIVGYTVNLAEDQNGDPSEMVDLKLEDFEYGV